MGNTPSTGRRARRGRLPADGALGSSSSGALPASGHLAAAPRSASSTALFSPPPPLTPQPPPIDPTEEVDGGRVAPVTALYHATHHYDPAAVRELIRARRLAPFYPGLDDVDEDNPAVSDNDPPAVAAAKQWMARVGGAVECPICFLFYPANINASRCCGQPLCTECFVQIKRPDAVHPAECPYCTLPDFAVVYTPPRLADQGQLPPPSALHTAQESSTQPIAIQGPARPAEPLRPEAIPLPESPTNASPATPPTLTRTLTVTATTHTRTNRTTSLTSLGGSGSPTHPPGSSAASLPSPTVPPDPQPSTLPRSGLDAPEPVTSDSIREAYVWRLRAEHQTATLREHQEAAASRLRRMLLEQHTSNAPQTGAGPSPFALLAAAAAASGSGSSSNSASRRARRHMERVMTRAALGVDLEELMIAEAMRQSVADEEERQRRMREEELQQQQQRARAVPVQESSSPAASGTGHMSPTGSDEDNVPIANLLAKASHLTTSATDSENTLPTSLSGPSMPTPAEATSSSS